MWDAKKGGCNLPDGRHVSFVQRSTTRRRRSANNGSNIAITTGSGTARVPAKPWLLNLVGSTDWHSFYWTAKAGMRPILVGDTEQDAFGVSGDGSVIVGRVVDAWSENTAYRWTTSGDFAIIAGGSSTPARAYAISRDGTTIVGGGGRGWGYGVFRWRSGVLEHLDTSGLGSLGAAHGVSGDGSVVAGYIDTTFGGPDHAFRWTSGGMQDLGTLGGTNSRAFAISDDGSTVVGESELTGDSTRHAFSWTSSGMQDLGTLDGTSAAAFAISGDGLVIVGMSELATGGENAFLWTSDLGMVNLNTYLPTLGIDLTGWTLTEARGLSFNGSVIAGTGTFNGETRAFLVTGVPEPAPPLSCCSVEAFWGGDAAVMLD